MSKQTAKKKAAKRGRPPKVEGGMDSSMTIKLPKNLHDAATRKSKETGVAVAFVVRKRLEEWVSEPQS